MSRKRWNGDVAVVRATIEATLREGRGSGEAAKRLGCSPPILRKFCAQHEIAMPTRQTAFRARNAAKAGIDLSQPQIVADLIQRKHWENGASLRELERELKLSNGLLSRWCIEHQIPVRDKVTQIRTSPRERIVRGPDHWAWGRRKESDSWAVRHSEQMLRDNPTRREDVRAEMANKCAERGRRQLTPVEMYFDGLLRCCGIGVVAQHPILGYVLDFAFPDYKVAIELDGKGHRDPDRRIRDEKRDKAIAKEGWVIFRVSNYIVSAPGKLLGIAQQFIPELQIPSNLPTSRGKHRVFVRNAQDFTVIRL